MKKLLLFIAFLSFTLIGYSAKDPLAKYKKAYESSLKSKSKRDFVRAYSGSKKIVSATVLSSDPVFQTDVLLNHVEIEVLIKGYSADIEKQLQTILGLKDKQIPENTGKVEIELAKIYMMLGEYARSEKILKKLEASTLSPFMLYEFKLITARLKFKQGYYLNVLQVLETELKNSDQIPTHLIAKYRALHAFAAYSYGNSAKSNEIITNFKNTYWKDKRFKQDLYVFLFLDALKYEADFKLDDAIEDLTKLLEDHNKELSAINVRDELISPEYLNEYLVITKYQMNNEDKDAVHNKYNTQLDSWYGRTSNKMFNKLLLDAREYITAHDYEKADSYLNDILDQKEIQNQKSLYTEALQLHLYCKIQLRNFHEIEQDFDDFLAFLSEIYPKDCPEYKKVELDKAVFLAENTNHAVLARKLFEDVFTSSYSAQKSPQNDELDLYKETYVDLLADFGYMNQALKIADELLQIMADEHGKDSPIYNYKLTSHALLALKGGKHEDALREIEEVLTYYKSMKAEGLDVAEALKTKAIILMASADYSEAQGLLNKADRNLKIPEEKQYFNKSFSLTRLYIEQGRFNKANKILNEFLTDLTHTYGSTNKKLLPVLTEKAWYLLKAGLYKEVEDQCLFNSLVADSVYGKTSFYADQEEILSLVYFERGDFESALVHSALALKIRIELLGEDHYKVGLSLKDQALISYNLGLLENDKIKLLFEKSLKTIATSVTTKSHLYALTLQDYARFLLETKDIKGAEVTIEQVENLWKEIGLKQKTNTYYSELLLLKGDLAKQKLQYDRAEEFYNKVASNIIDVFGENHPLYSRALSRLSRIYYIQKNKDLTIKTTNTLIKYHLSYINTYFSSLSEKEKTKYWLLIKNDFEFYHNVVFRYKDENPILVENLYNLTLQTKSLLLNNSIKIRESVYKSNDAELISLYNELTQKKEEVLMQLNTSKQDKSDSKESDSNLEKEIKQLEKRLSEKVSFYKPNIDEVSQKEIKKALKDNEYAVEIVSFRYFDKNFTDSTIYLALLVDHNPNHGVILEVFKYGTKMEKEYFSYFRNTKMLKVDDKYSYNIYWEPVTKHIPEQSTVFISPDGIYNLINPETFQKPDGSYLLDKYNFRILSNSKDILYEYQDTLKEANTAVLVGNPAFYPSEYEDFKHVKTLPGAELEIKEISQIFKNNNWKFEKMLNQHVLEDSVKFIKSPTVLHFATHGYFKPEEDELNDNLVLKQKVSTSLFAAGLVLSNGGVILDRNKVAEYNDDLGLLTAYEVLNMNLNNTKLVVLSACETGLGTGEIGDGVYGLQKAFLVAGAKNVVMSIFKVDDAITRELMVNFYTLWLSGTELHKAFQQAKVIIKNKYKDPIYWGSFILIEK